MQELQDLAEKVKNQLDLNYDSKSVKYLEAFIERQRGSFEGEDLEGLINSIGAFLGQCVITNYGGQWQLDPETQQTCIAFDDKNKVYPFSKTAKQFENGLEESVYSFYTIIPVVFKDQISIKHKAGAAQEYNEYAGVKKWWKFW